MRTIDLVSIGLAAVSVACAGATGPSDGEQNTELPAVRVEYGARYVPLRRNNPEDFVIKAPEDEGAFEEEEEIDLESLTDEELAKRMVGLTELDGWVYRVEPQIELMPSVRRRLAEPRLASRGHGPVSVNPDGLTARAVIDDGRNRTRQRNNTTYPFTTIVQMDNTWGGCTGTMIGASTLISAAHCFFDGTNFRAPFAFRPGADAQDSNPYPFGEWYCYGVVLPADGGLNNIGNDYAVVDFRSPWHGCDDYPGNATGWMGTRSPSSTTLRNDTMNLHGYPVDKSPYPQIWGMSGRITNVLSTVLNFDMDGEGGQSGSSVRWMLDGWPHVVGLYSGGQFDFGFTINRGMRNRAAVETNIDAWSTEY